MKPEYQEQGYFVIQDFFSRDDLHEIHEVLKSFHLAWLQDNPEAVANGVLNSAWITGKKYLEAYERLELLKFVASQRLMDVVATVIPGEPAFMNTQLFFNPANPGQRNYWHRDIQYMPLSIAEQQAALASINVVHFRIPLEPEHGVEVVPGSHSTWDTDEEFDTRMERNGRHRCDDLESGKQIALEPGGLLVFSANMIHRGLYGLDRFAFDIIYCDSDPELLEFTEPDCLPDAAEMGELENPVAFTNSRRLLNDMGRLL